MVNEEYGNFQMQLTQSAADERWRVNSKQFIAKPNDRKSFQRLEIIESLNDDPANYTPECDQHVRHSIPTEWTRFYVLIARCIIHNHRDWVI